MWSMETGQLTLTREEGIELRRRGPLVRPRLTGRSSTRPRCPVTGAADNGLVCKQVPADRGSAEESRVLVGPDHENLGRPRPHHSNLLKSPHDEALFEHYLQRSWSVGTERSPRRRPRSDEDPFTRWRVLSWRRCTDRELPRPASRFPSKKGMRSLHRPRSRRLRPYPRRHIPIARGSVRTGKRTVAWRADEPATLWRSRPRRGDAAAEADGRTDQRALRALDGEFMTMRSRS